VLLTVDKSMPSQQVVERYSVAVIILRAQSNRIADLKPLKPNIQNAIERCDRGKATVVS
jgi:hypothetical protein